MMLSSIWKIPLISFLLSSCLIHTVVATGPSPNQKTCNLDKDEKLKGTLLMDFVGKPVASDIEVFAQAVGAVYNESVSCTSGFRIIETVEMRTKDLNESQFQNYTLEFKIDGLCQDCLKDTVLLWDDDATCNCAGPTRVAFQVNLASRLEALISSKDISSDFGDLLKIVEVMELTCPATKTFDTSLLIDFEGNVEAVDTSTLARLSTLVADTYNDLNGLNTITCDFQFRQIVEVSANFDNVVPQPDTFSIRFLLRVTCRGCDPETAKAFDDIENIVTNPFEIRRLLSSEHRRRRLTNTKDDKCRCPVDPEYRSVSENEFLIEIQQLVAEDRTFGGFGVVDAFEIEPVDCEVVTSSFTTQVEFFVDNIGRELSPAEEQEIAQDFKASYNTLAERYCDPFFRFIDSVAIISEELVVPDFVPDRRRRLQNSNRFILTITASCRGCPDDTQLYDDGIRRALQTAHAHHHRYLESTTCFCSAVTVTLGAPTEREGALALERNIQQTFPSSQVVVDEAGIASRSINRTNQCQTDTDCTSRSVGDFCVADICIHEGNPRFTLTWTGDDDLDLEVTTPQGFVLSFRDTYDPETRGIFDTGFSQTSDTSHVESVVFPRDGSAPGGEYTVNIRQFEQRGLASDTWTLSIFQSGMMVQSAVGSGTSESIPFFYGDGPGPSGACSTTDPLVECCGGADCAGVHEVCENRQCVSKGNPRFLLTWFGDDDLSLKVRTPEGVTIGQQNPSDTSSGGVYEADFNQGVAGTQAFHAEAIVFPTDGSAQDGTFSYYVESVQQRGIVPDEWTVTVFYNGENFPRTGSGDSATELAFQKFPVVDGIVNEGCIVDSNLIECCEDKDCNDPPRETCINTKCIKKGTPRFTLSWIGDDDLDLFVFAPDGTEIFWNNTEDAASGGVLTADPAPTSDFTHVESVSFDINGNSPEGLYQYGVNLWDLRGESMDTWNLTVSVDGEEVSIIQGQGTSLIQEFVYDSLSIDTCKEPTTQSGQTLSISLSEMVDVDFIIKALKAAFDSLRDDDCDTDVTSISDATQGKTTRRLQSGVLDFVLELVLTCSEVNSSFGQCFVQGLIDNSSLLQAFSEELQAIVGNPNLIVTNFQLLSNQMSPKCVPLSSFAPSRALDYPYCTPFRSVEYCDFSFPELIQKRKSAVTNNLLPSSHWYTTISDKVGGLAFAKSLGIPAPDLYCCSQSVSDMFSCISSVIPSGNGYVIQAVGQYSQHSNGGVFVFPVGIDLSGTLEAPELLRNTTYNLTEVSAEIDSLNATRFLVSEYISGSVSENTLPQEYKFHMFKDKIGSISVIRNRGTDLGYYAEVDEDWNRLDRFGCFKPGGSVIPSNECPGLFEIDCEAGERDPFKMKGFNLPNSVPTPLDCALERMKSLAVQLGQAIGVYMRVDFFVTDSGDVFLQEFTPNHNNGLRHCAAKEISNGCIDSCFMGRMWQNNTVDPANFLFGGDPPSPVPPVSTWVDFDFSQKCTAAQQNDGDPTIRAAQQSHCP